MTKMWSSCLMARQTVDTSIFKMTLNDIQKPSSKPELKTTSKSKTDNTGLLIVQSWC